MDDTAVKVVDAEEEAPRVNDPLKHGAVQYAAVFGDIPIHDAVLEVVCRAAALMNRICGDNVAKDFQHTEDSIKELETEANDFVTKYIYTLFGAVNTTKMHRLAFHLGQELRLRGNLQEADTSVNEMLHKIIKAMYRVTNKHPSTFQVQMLRCEQTLVHILATEANDKQRSEAGLPPTGQDSLVEPHAAAGTTPNTNLDGACCDAHSGSSASESDVRDAASAAARDALESRARTERRSKGADGAIGWSGKRSRVHGGGAGVRGSGRKRARETVPPEAVDLVASAYARQGQQVIRQPYSDGSGAEADDESGPEGLNPRRQLVAARPVRRSNVAEEPPPPKRSCARVRGTRVSVATIADADGGRLRQLLGLLNVTPTQRLTVVNSLCIDAEFEWGAASIMQRVRAAPRLIDGTPWWDHVVYADNSRPGHARVGLVRLVIRAVDGIRRDLVVVQRLAYAAPRDGCILTEFGCDRLQWDLDADTGHPRLELVSPARIQRLEHVVPDFEDLSDRRGLYATPSNAPETDDERQRQRFFTNAFFPWSGGCIDDNL